MTELTIFVSELVRKNITFCNIDSPPAGDAKCQISAERSLGNFSNPAALLKQQTVEIARKDSLGIECASVIENHLPQQCSLQQKQFRSSCRKNSSKSRGVTLNGKAEREVAWQLAPNLSGRVPIKPGFDSVVGVTVMTVLGLRRSPLR